MRCSGCGFENPGSAKFCQECGAPQQRSCTGCGAALPPAANFCHECGAAQKAAGRAPSAGTAGGSEPATAPRARTAESLVGGRYEVRRLLGEGSRKRVYLARDTRLGREVALSLIKTEGLDEAGRQRVRHETQAMAKLGDHRNVVTVHDVGADGETFHIVSEYMDGGDVAGHLRAAEGGRLSVEEALRIASEVAAALAHAHDHGVVHRDVKPGNVWLKRDGGVALGDFGLAVSADRTRITAEGMMVGTVSYMPPEQALGRPADARSDLYALGVTLYEMLTGRPPFAGDDAVAIISQHIHTPPVAPSWHTDRIPKPLDELVLRLLAKAPEQRPASAAEVKKALDAIAEASLVAPAISPDSLNLLDSLASGVFVGREHEVARLRAAADAALSGDGRICLLVGEPGIGKTRTAEELGTYASMRGARVLWGRCYEGEGAPTYWPWVQIVRAYTQDRDPAALLGELGAGASAIADVVSEVRDRIPGLQPAVALEPEEARFRLFDSIASFLRRASRQQPLVLVLDDLHWADEPSLLLLQFLARDLAGARILLVGTYRDVDLSRKHPLVETLGELGRAKASERIVLRGLAEGDVARFLELSTGRAPAPGMAEAVFRETEGNPFFVQEVVRLLTSERRLDGGRAGWSAEIPQGIRDAIGRRLNQLSEACNELLSVASVIGRDFDAPVLERAVELPGEQVLELLEEALASRLVQESGDGAGRYRFSHALVRETLYGELNTSRRVRLHRRIGETLESVWGDATGTRLASLAYHFAEGAHGGGDVAKAIAYARRAGDHAVSLSAHGDAAPHYRRALDVLELQERPDPGERCDLLLALGGALNVAGDTEAAKPVLKQAIELARSLGDARRFARGAADLAEAAYMLGLTQQHVTVLEEAIEALGDEDCAERSRALNRLGLEFWLGDQHERAKQLMREGLDVARRVGNQAALVDAVYSLNVTLTGSPDLSERRALVDEAFELARRFDNPELLTQAHISAFYLCFATCDLEGAWRHSEAMEPLLRRTQNGRSTYLWMLQQATRAIVEGRLDDADARAREAFQFGMRLGGDAALQMYGAQITGIRYFQGRLRELPLTFGAVRHPQPVWRAGAAWSYAVLGDEAECRKWFEPLAANDFAAVPHDTNWPAALGMAARAAAFLRDREPIEHLYAEMLPWRELNLQVGAAVYGQGPGSAHMAAMDRALGRLDRAVELMDEALERTERMGFRPWIPVFSLEQASTLLERGGKHDTERALRHLERAIEESRSMGMRGVLEDALALRLELQGIDAKETQRSVYAVARSVQDRRPDFGEMTASDGTVTLVFSDIEGFTRMTERLGDAEAHRVVQRHHGIVREAVRAHGGHEVELRGDGFLLAFEEPARALRCCIELQREFERHNAEHPEQPIRLRIGLHHGQAIREADRFFGVTVIRAFRIADLANGDEILVSEELREIVASDPDFRFDDGREAELKGISGRHRLFRVDWQAPAPLAT